MRCRYATTPRNGVGVCVSTEMGAAFFGLLVPSREFRGSPGWSRTNRQRHIRSSCFPYNTGPQSGRWESNPRSRAPKARGPPLPFLPISCVASSSSYGSRTHLSVLKGRNPQTDRRTSRKFFCQWVGRRSNPRLRLFRPPLYRLSYQPEFPSTSTKKARCRVTPGLQVVCILGFGRASQAHWESQIIRGECGITRPYAFLDRTGP
jgi:hypothetical protein